MAARQVRRVARATTVDAHSLRPPQNRRRAGIACPRQSRARSCSHALPFQIHARPDNARWTRSDAISREPHPMQRLLQGDVGSGKTIVAALAALQAVENGDQVAVMAPTEILAEQHYAQILDWLAPLGIKRGLAVGQPAAQRQAREPRRDCVGRSADRIGTHALFQDDVEFSRARPRHRRRAASFRRAPAARAAASKARCRGPPPSRIS